VSAVPGRRSEQIPRAFAAAALLAATLLAAAVGAALGNRYAAEQVEPPSAGAQPRIGLTSGAARLPLPAGWEPLERRSSLPGLEEATAVRGVHSDVALDIRDVEDASLLPAGVEQAVGGLPQPRRRRLGAHTAWRYDLPGARPAARIVALALPTTAGVVTIACGSERGAIARAATECEGAAGAVRLDGASALAPTPETAAAVALPNTVAQLNRRRTRERRRLAATLSPLLRSAAALRLARAYADAAARLRPLAAGDALRVTALLATLARQHRALAEASRQRDAGAALRAGATIERDEPRLGTLLTAVTGPAADG
jgi:hypothetical protein